MKLNLFSFVKQYCFCGNDCEEQTFT